MPDDVNAYLPTQEEIQAHCERFQQGWKPAIKANRMGMTLKQWKNRHYKPPVAFLSTLSNRRDIPDD